MASRNAKSAASHARGVGELASARLEDAVEHARADAQLVGEALPEVPLPGDVNGDQRRRLEQDEGAHHQGQQPRLEAAAAGHRGYGAGAAVHAGRLPPVGGGRPIPRPGAADVIFSSGVRSKRQYLGERPNITRYFLVQRPGSFRSSTSTSPSIGSSIPMTMGPCSWRVRVSACAGLLHESVRVGLAVGRGSEHAEKAPGEGRVVVRDGRRERSRRQDDVGDSLRQVRKHVLLVQEHDHGDPVVGEVQQVGERGPAAMAYGPAPLAASHHPAQPELPFAGSGARSAPHLLQTPRVHQPPLLQGGEQAGEIGHQV